MEFNENMHGIQSVPLIEEIGENSQKEIQMVDLTIGKVILSNLD